MLFIAIDDLRPELGSFGVSYAPTPHLDRLAQQGVAFTRHFVQVPTCGASRYALLTGRSPARSGVTRSNAACYQGRSALSAKQLAGAQTMPELFRRSGYRTVLIGKLSHTPDGRVFAYNGKGNGRHELRHARDELMATSRRDYSVKVSRRADGERWRLNFVELFENLARWPILLPSSPRGGSRFSN